MGKNMQEKERGENYKKTQTQTMTVSNSENVNLIVFDCNSSWWGHSFLLDIETLHLLPWWHCRTRLQHVSMVHPLGTMDTEKRHILQLLRHFSVVGSSVWQKKKMCLVIWDNWWIVFEKQIKYIKQTCRQRLTVWNRTMQFIFKLYLPSCITHKS